MRKKISFVFVKIKSLEQKLKQQMVNIKLPMCNYTLDIPYNEKLEHRRPLCIERERNPFHILLVAMCCYGHYTMRGVSPTVMPCNK